MHIFVILPDQLFCSSSALEAINLCEEICLIEDPKYFPAQAHKTVLASRRANMRAYYRLLQEKLDKNKLRYVDLAKVHSKKKPDSEDPCEDALDYLLGVKKEVNMFRISPVWEYGEKPWKYTYYGLPIKFHEAPSFLLTYREVRDNYKPKHKYKYSTIFKAVAKIIKLPAEMVDNVVDKFYGGRKPSDVKFKGHLTRGDSEFRNAKNYLKKADLGEGTPKRTIIGHEEAKNYLEYFLEHVLPSYQSGDCLLFFELFNSGLLEPAEVVSRVLTSWESPRGKTEGEDLTTQANVFIEDVIYREYLRVLYLANPDIQDYNFYEAKDALMPQMNSIMGISNIQNVLGILGSEKKYNPRKTIQWFWHHTTWAPPYIISAMIPGVIKCIIAR